MRGSAGSTNTDQENDVKTIYTPGTAFGEFLLQKYKLIFECKKVQANLSFFYVCVLLV